jgi:hypothetical protein
MISEMDACDAAPDLLSLLTVHGVFPRPGAAACRRRRRSKGVSASSQRVVCQDEGMIRETSEGEDARDLLRFLTVHGVFPRSRVMDR